MDFSSKVIGSSWVPSKMEIFVLGHNLQQDFDFRVSAEERVGNGQ